MKHSQAGLRIIVAAGFLCVGSYGQDSSGIRTPVNTTLEKPEMSTIATQLTTQPDSTVVQEPTSTGSSANIDSVANTDLEANTNPDATTNPVADTDSGTKVPIQSAPVVEKVVAGADSAKPNNAGDEKVLELEKDVVVGYGTMKKEDLTGSVTAVKTEELARDAVYSVRKALQGKAAGVTVVQNSGQPGKAVTVRVRGVGTINNANPLYVVDGTPVNSVDYLNPNDIESMAILKDASATAIYGSRGANGVIMVTTKKGKEGISGITYDMFVGTSRPWKKPSMCNAEEWAMLNNEARKAAGLELYPELKDPSSLGEGTNWFKEITRKNAFIQQQNVSVAQGTEKLKYFLSAGLFNQEGIVKKSGLDKVMLRFNAGQKISDWFTLGNDVGFGHTATDYANEQDEHNSTIISMLSMDPVTKVRDNAGNLVGSNFNNVQNPVGRVENFNFTEKNTSFTGSLFADMDIIHVLKFKSTFGMDMLFKDSSVFIPKFQISANDGQPDAFVLRRTGTDFTWIVENTLSYENIFLDDHSLKLLTGTTSQERTWDSVRAENQQTPSNDPSMRQLSSTLGPTPRVEGTEGGNSLASFFGRMEYEYANKYLLTATYRADGSSRFAPKNRWGHFPSVAGAWKISQEPFMSKVNFIEGLKLRVGWGKTGNQEIGDYLFLTTEPLKQDYSFNGAIASGTVSLSSGNPTIKWEEQTAINAGLDLNVLGGRIEFSGDYFIKTTDGMLVQPQIPTMTGLRTSPIVNGGTIENRGVELVLNYKESVGSFLSDISINFSTYKNKVISLGGDNTPIMDADVRNAGQVSRTEVGHPIACFYGLKTDGLFQNRQEIDSYTYLDKDGKSRKIQPNVEPGDIKYRDDNRDGVLDKDFIGSPHPDFTMGLNVDAAYKGFDVSMSFLGVYGNELFNGTRWYTDNITAFYGLDSRMLGRWTGEGSTNDANLPRMNNADANNILLSDRYVEDGSYLRLKTLQVGYSLDNSFLRRIRIKKCRIYIGAENLFTLTRYSGLEPEIGLGDQDNQNTFNSALCMGIDRGTYPQARTFMVGLNLTL